MFRPDGVADVSSGDQHARVVLAAWRGTVALPPQPRRSQAGQQGEQTERGDGEAEQVGHGRGVYRASVGLSEEPVEANQQSTHFHFTRRDQDWNLS